MTGGKKLLLGGIVAVLAIFIAITLLPGGEPVPTPETVPATVEEAVPGDPDEKAAFDRRKAASACRVGILQSLKEPSTAQFLEELHGTPWVAEDGGEYRFTIGVRAQSAAGMVDRQFVCRAHPEPNGWSIAALTERPLPASP
jgi:hypothetical protein